MGLVHFVTRRHHFLVLTEVVLWEIGEKAPFLANRCSVDALQGTFGPLINAKSALHPSFALVAGPGLWRAHLTTFPRQAQGTAAAVFLHFLYWWN